MNQTSYIYFCSICVLVCPEKAGKFYVVVVYHKLALIVYIIGGKHTHTHVYIYIYIYINIFVVYIFPLYLYICCCCLSFLSITHLYINGEQ